MIFIEQVEGSSPKKRKLVEDEKEVVAWWGFFGFG
jgi:hypothetical protein